jgi:vacuolar-type H+-ATPase subunit H
MTRQREQPREDPIVAAIERVLAAERDGEQQLRSVRRHAETVIARARVEAAAVVQRVNDRIAKLRSAYLQKVEKKISRMTASSNSLDDDPVDRTALAAAAQHVAARLTGGT